MDMSLTELVFILDRSGSMGGLESDTIGGYNGMMAKQKKEGEKVNVTTILFDDRTEILHDRFSIEDVRPLTNEDYYVRGCTALLDAVGKTVLKVENVQNRLPEEKRAGKVIFIITTDGLENASREFSYERVRKMIEAKKEAGWEFLFLGANIDAAAEAGKIGIRPDRAVTFENDSEGIALNYETLGRTVRKVTKSRSTKCMVDPCWSEEIRDYHEKKNS